MIAGAIRCAAVALALSQGGVSRATAPQGPPKRVAITIDDLPVVSRNFQTAADHDRITRQLVGALGAHRVPAVGFVNAWASLVIVGGTPLVGLTFSLPGDGRIGFVALGAVAALAALATPR